MATAIEIKGRKGGKSKSRTPTEQPDDLQSVAKAKILMALGEGEFAGGLTAKDIYLDGTPLENADGSQNFSGVAWEFRSGTQAQAYIQGIPGSENEISLGTEIKSTTAWTHTFTNSQLSAIRLRLKWGSLFTQEDNGDLVGNTVKYAIDLQTDGGTWQTVIDTAVTGKTTSGYERSHRIDLPQAGSTWTVRLRKITTDANSAKVGDKMSLQSYTEVIDAKLRYPNTALLYIEFDSSQFNGSIPQITCEPRGRVIRVPDTYDPESRTYNGIWTGAFKWAWTDNPAWIFYDLVVSDRFGLGNRLTAQNISKWTLYEVAQYCDQLVPDGKGGDGKEPRYICNVYVQDRNDAYTVLRDFAAIFRGMVYWGGDQIVALADMPRDVDYTYTRANVVDGKFTYSSSSAKTRYTTALVSWSDPANAYADAMEPVFEQPLVARYGFNQLEMTAIGCTRQSEANRKGRWGILTNNKDRIVTFGVGLEGNIPQPGYIIAVADEMLAGRSNGGRISSVSGRVITFDRNVNAPAGARLQVNLPSGISQSRTIQSVNGGRQVTVTTPFSETPQPESVWAIEWDDLSLQQYRVVSVSDNNDGTYTVTGAAHDPNKFPRIDTGVIIDAPPVSIVPPGHQSPPERVDITSYSIVNQGISIATMRATWPDVKNAIAYEAQWRRNDGNWINIPRSSTTSFEVSGIYAGRYLVRVRAINAAEVSSGWAYSEEKTLTGKIGEPLAPVGLATTSLTAGIEISWGFPANSGDTQRTEVQYSPNQDGTGALPLTDIAYPGNRYQQMGLQFAQQFWYRARLVDRLGNKSPWTGWIYGMASDNMDDYYKNLDDAIRDTDTWGELNSGIKDSSDAAQHAQDAADAAQRSADAMANDVAKNAADITQAAQQGKTNADNLAKEVRDRAAGDLANAKKAADDVAAAIKKAQTDDAAVAREAADNLLSAKNEVEAQISSTNTTMQDVFDSLAQQIASVSAGTGEQFDSLKIWYFDNGPEGWSADDSGNSPLPTTEEGWVLPAGSASTMRSPNPLAVDGTAYKYLRLRIQRVGNPTWRGAMYWIGADETGWADTRRLIVDEPAFDPATGLTVLSVADIRWGSSGTIRRLRFDFATNQDANNYFAVDWFAVGRPTPGASQAQIQDLRSAMTSADAAEAAARNTLAVQLRGNETGTDPNKLVSGLLYNERKARVTAEQAIASDVNTLRTDYNANKSSVTQRLDTLASENQAQANSLTQLDSGLKDANSKIGANSSAIQNLKTSVTAIDGRVSANSQAITGLSSTLNGMSVGGTNLLLNSDKSSAPVRLRSPSSKYATYSMSPVSFMRAADIKEPTPFTLSLWYQELDDGFGTEKPFSTVALGKGSSGDNWSLRFYVYQGKITRYADNLYRWTGTLVAPAGSKIAVTGNAVTIILEDVTQKTGCQLVRFQLERGTLATDWRAAQEDNASADAVQGLTTRVDAAEGRIETASQAITQLRGDVSSVQGDLAKKADASALQQLQTTVTQQGKTLSTQGSAITELQNSATNGKKNCWVQQLFYIRAPGSTYIPSLSDLAGVQPASISEVADAASLDFTSAGSNVYAYFRALVYVSADKEVVCKPGSRVMDDTGQIYINSVSVAKLSSTEVAVTLPFKKGWNTIEVVTQQWSGNAYFRLGLKLSDNVDQMFSGAGQLAAASASQVLNSRVEATEGNLTSQGQLITQLNNSLGDVNKALGNKADASALTSLTNRVSSAEGKLASQGESITALSNSITAGENLVPNPNMLNDGQGWAKQGAATIDGYPALYSTTGWQPSSGKLQVTPGDILDLAVSIQVSAAASLSVGLRFDGPGVSNVTAYTGDHTFTAGEKYRFEKTGIVVPAGCTTAFLQTNGHTTVTVSLYNPVITRRTAAVTANAAAINSLTSRVTSTEGKITSQGQSLTSLQSTLSGLSGKVDGKADAGAVNSLTNRVTAAEGKLTAQGQSLTSLQNSLSSSDASADADGNIPGNMVANASFERGQGGYTTWHEKVTVVTGGNFGSRCARFSSGSAAGIGQKITFRKGRVYRIGVYAKQDAGTVIQDTSNTKFRIADARGLVESRQYGPFTQAWQEISFEWKATRDDALDVQVTAYLSAGAMYFDDFYVLDVTDEKNIQANAGAISSLQSSVTKLGNDITSQSSAVTSLSNSLDTINKANGNLWVDGSFESYAEGTTLSGATAMVTRAYNYSGSQCLRVRRDGGDKGNSDKTIGTRTTVRDQGVFRIEFYAMMPASESPPSGWNVPVGIHVQDAESANQWIEATRVTEAALGGRDRWVKFSGTAALPGGKTRGVLWISTRGTSGGVGYNLFIDDLVITDVTDAAGAQKTADAASTALTSLTTKVSSIDGQVTANSTALTKLTSRVNDAESSITGLNETVAQNGLAMANGFNQMRSMIGDNSASITQTNKTVADLEKSTAEQVNTLNSKYGDMSSTVQQTASTVADINGKLSAQWGVKVATGNGGTPVVAGIQLGINGSGQSQFLVSADTFGVYTPGAAGNQVMAFAVEGATAYLRSTMIKEASIDFAKISDTIQSTNYVPGQQGWRIAKGGGSEFHNVLVRGEVHADSGVFNGTINATDGKFSGTVEARNFIGDISNSGRFPDFTFDDRSNGVTRIVHHDSGDASQAKTYTVSGMLYRYIGGKTMEVGIWINNIEVVHMKVTTETNVQYSASRYIPIQATLSGIYDRNVPCEIRVDEKCQIISAHATMTRGSGGWTS
ncbi:TipJ family phage tail tip protein [Pluralibacter gergoviae]|uniref:TipJ family phage tail tip protein n=1 Tax=Pluralibacter gergoviae TaxID=61647 RepID=UPI0009E25C11|nr:phage tail protein [Pluralibacter gergoviae]